MQKNYCDVCNEEIGVSELKGGFMKLTEVYPVAENPFGKKEQFQTQKQIEPEIADLCQKCTETCAEFLEKIGAEKRQEALKAAEKIVDKKT